jgi:predicted nuclease of restriction endonuclease-like RecB superfamily
MFRKIRLPVFFLLVLLSQQGRAQEEKYIGLFVYNFTKFFDWPAEAKGGDFVIIVLGHESVARELKVLSSQKKVGTQNIVVRALSDHAEIGKCQIIFVGFWHSRYLPEIIEKLKPESCLIITEKDGLLQQGAAINFLIHENAIKFELKKSNATTHNLKIDPRIAELALNVEE